MDKRKYQFDKLRNRKTGNPIATIAYYGPDNRFASKVVVGIMLSEKDEEPTYLQNWFAQEQNFRQNQTLLHEILDYIQANQVRRVVMVDGIIGCPHEEGIDYPEGQTCPTCIFWENRDRWTGELLSKGPG